MLESNRWELARDDSEALLLSADRPFRLVLW
jgi:hypothetical protein